MANIRDEAEKKAKAFYSQIGSVPCPELSGEMVAFNSMGFRHLLLKHGIRRSKKEQRRRFSLLAYAVEIVEKSGKLIAHREGSAGRPVHHRKKKIFRPSDAIFWKLAGEVDGKRIVVIIRQFRGGKKHFLSIYSKKNKKLPS